MSVPLSSTDSLERLCVTHPSKPVTQGIMKLSTSIAALGIAVGSAWLNTKSGGMLNVPDHSALLVAGVGIQAATVGTTVMGAGYSGYTFFDAITSLTGTRRIPKTAQNQTMYRNAGFTNTPSLSDRLFGTRVLPIEHPHDITKSPKGKLFLNGVHITKTCEDPYSRLQASKTNKYIVTLHGELKGVPVSAQLATTSPYSDIAKHSENTSVYLLGTPNSNGTLEIEMIGPALTH